MRFNKGSKVEVLNNREDPAGSWWCAEIISGNGHNYYVRYDRNLSDVGSLVERVPRRAIRPCPPSEKGRLDWVPGDIVEVLDNFSWMLAKIVMFSGGEYFAVRLLGSSTELIVRSSSIRLRKCWHDNKWVIFQKIFEMSVKKRARTCSSPREKCIEAFRKIRAVEKEGFPQGVFTWNSTWEKVDDVASPRKLFGEKYMHSSLININTGTFETNQGVIIANADSGHCSRLMLEDTDAESISSSVGSCGVKKSPCRSTWHPFYGTGQYVESYHDLSEASANLGRETSLTTIEALDQGPQLEACNACFHGSKVMVGLVAHSAIWTLLQHV